MFIYHRIRTNPRNFRGMTGLDINEFDLLIPAFEDAWITCMETTNDGWQSALVPHVCILSQLPLSIER